MMYPHEIKKLEESENKELLKDFLGERTGYLQIGAKNWLLPSPFSSLAESYYNLSLREDDVWIVTFPRSGTTVCQELVWLINNCLDYETAARVPLIERVPFLEVMSLMHPEFIQSLKTENAGTAAEETVSSWGSEDTVEFVEKLPSPRHFKTHLPFSLLPPDLPDKCKVIYVARNPRDVAVSYYYHNRLGKMHDYKGDFLKYWNYFKRNLVVYAPYWEHVSEGWERKEKILFLFYEDLVTDMNETIKRVARYLHKEMSEEDVKKLADHLQIDNFRKNVPLLSMEVEVKGIHNENEQGFIRKGKIGGNAEFTADLIKDSEVWISEKLSKYKIPFRFK